MSGALETPLLRLAAGYVFVAIVLAIAARWKVGRTWEIVLATFRMTVQLVAVGYLLDLVCVRPNPWITLAVFLVMEAFAVRNVFARGRVPTPAKLRTTIIGSLAFGTVVVVFFFLLGIIAVDPWYEPRYFIPISGMLIGNSMTGIALGYDRLTSGFRANAQWIESAIGYRTFFTPQATLVEEATQEA